MNPPAAGSGEAAKTQCAVLIDARGLAIARLEILDLPEPAPAIQWGDKRFYRCADGRYHEVLYTPGKPGESEVAVG